jgi:hypothetical protein
MSVKAISSMVLFSARISLLIFCLDVLPINGCGVRLLLLYYTIIVLGPICSFQLRNICFMNLGSPDV